MQHTCWLRHRSIRKLVPPPRRSTSQMPDGPVLALQRLDSELSKCQKPVAVGSRRRCSRRKRSQEGQKNPPRFEGKRHITKTTCAKLQRKTARWAKRTRKSRIAFDKIEMGIHLRGISPFTWGNSVRRRPSSQRRWLFWPQQLLAILQFAHWLEHHTNKQLDRHYRSR